MGTIKKTENLQADIVVIGGGGAGLPAAVAAADAGVKNIIVLEKAEKLGGSANYGMGFFAVGSPSQERLDIKVSADEVFREKMELANWKTDAKLTRTFVNKSGDIVRWLEGKGLKFNTVLRFQPEGEGQQTFHMLQPGFIRREERWSRATGSKVVNTLAKECEKLGIQIFCNTPAKKILADKKGAVSGVLAKTKGGELKIAAKSVIIAAGGFSGNKKMFKKYFPLHENTWGLRPPEMAGDGLVMAEELGAITDDQIAILIMGPNHYHGTHGLNMIVRRPHVLLVNKHGERYGDESVTPHFLTLASNMLARQPDQICFALMDEKIKQDMIQNRESASGQEKDQGGGVAWLDQLDHDLQKDATNTDKKTTIISDSWDEIAEWIGAKPEVLKATIERYNSFCDNGYDADFIKEPNYLLPLRTPPYYAIIGQQGFDCTAGGIKINHRMEVINKQHNVIPGLYAVGDNAGSWAPEDYPITHPGTSLGFAYTSGYLAGENAAKYVSGKE